MKVAVLGSSGEIGGKVVEELLSDGVDVRRGLRTGAGAPHFDISDRTGATRLIAWADVVVDATPSWVCNPVVTRALEHVPVVSTGHVAIAGQALHVSCAGALPGVLTGVPLLLPRRDRKVVSRTMISAPLSRSAARDMLQGARRGPGAVIRRDVRMPLLDAEVDLVGYADTDTALIDGRFAHPVEWWSAWAGRRFRDALFSAVGMDPDQAASVLSAAAGNGVVPGCEVLAQATDGIDEVGVRVASMTTLCAAMAVSCVKVLGGLGTAGMTALPQQLTALDLLLRTGTAVGQVIETAGGVITRAPDEEGEL